LLATDRPNTLKVFAGYDFDFHLFGKKMDTRIGASQLVYQGTPLSSTVQIQLVGNDELGNPCGSCSHGVSMLINGRGDLGRTDVYTNTDAFLNYRFYLSERVAFTFNVNVNNLWNEANETDRSVALINATTPAIANEYNTPRNTLKYGSAAVTLSQAYNLMLANIANYRTEFASILNGPDKNDFYNKPILFQQRRSFRLAFGIQF